MLAGLPDKWIREHCCYVVVTFYCTAVAGVAQNCLPCRISPILGSYYIVHHALLKASAVQIFLPLRVGCCRAVLDGTRLCAPYGRSSTCEVTLASRTSP